MAESACVALAVSRPSLRRTTMRRSVGCGGAETKARAAASAAAKRGGRRSVWGGGELKGRAGGAEFIGEGEGEFGLLAELHDGDARARAEVGEDSERGLALCVDDVARAAGAVEEEEERAALRARGEVCRLDRLAFVEHLEVGLRESGDALPSRVGDEEGNGH